MQITIGKGSFYYPIYEIQSKYHVACILINNGVLCTKKL